MDGYPCKSISPQNNNAKSFKDTSSVTGSGHDSLMKYVDTHRPEVVVCENVYAIMHKRHHDPDVPIEIQHKAFDRRGYFPVHRKVSACEFGLSQSRTRCYALYVKKNGRTPLICKFVAFVDHTCCYVCANVMPQTSLIFQCGSDIF